MFLAPNGWPLLHIAVAGEASLVIKLLLVRTDILRGATTDIGMTALYLVMQSIHQQYVKHLLATGKVDPNSKINAGESPLSLAIPSHSLVVASALLSTGKVHIEARSR